MTEIVQTWPEVDDVRNAELPNLNVDGYDLSSMIGKRKMILRPNEAIPGVTAAQLVRYMFHLVEKGDKGAMSAIGTAYQSKHPLVTLSTNFVSLFFDDRADFEFSNNIRRSSWTGLVGQCIGIIKERPRDDYYHGVALKIIGIINKCLADAGDSDLMYNFAFKGRVIRVADDWDRTTTKLMALWQDFSFVVLTEICRQLPNETYLLTLIRKSRQLPREPKCVTADMFRR